MRRALPSFGLALLLCLGAGGCRERAAPGEVLLPVKTAPEFDAYGVRRGGSVRLSDERGRALMLAFGYTSCADVCPATLASIHAVYRRLGDAAGKVDAFYVSIDPERDRPAEFREFLGHFDERIEGLVVPHPALDRLLSSYGVTAIKRPPTLQHYVGHDIDPAKDYSFDHSAGILVVDPLGRLRIHYAFDADPSVVARGIRRLLDEKGPRLRVANAKLVTYRSDTGAGYLELRNSGNAVERLTGASSPAARAVELHELVHEGDVARMQPAGTGFSIPASGTLALAPGGKHLMFQGIELAPGAHTLPVVLTFAGEPPLRVELEVTQANDASATKLGALDPAPSVPAGGATPVSFVQTPAMSTPPPVAETDASAANNEALLRVCADPNNLPFSNERGEGFENRLATLVARALGREVRYTFWPQRRGFLRLTLNAHRCDLVMGVPLGTERVLTTVPYYRSTYVFVYGPHAPRVRSLDAPELHGLRIGVPVVGDDGANPPPVVALVEHGLVQNLRGYSVYGDYRTESPPADLVRAVRAGEVDLGIAWGPLAGYYARRGTPVLAIRALPEHDAPPGQRFTFELAMAVRKDSAELRDRLNHVIATRAREIAALLDAYGVPRL